MNTATGYVLQLKLLKMASECIQLSHRSRAGNRTLTTIPTIEIRHAEMQ